MSALNILIVEDDVLTQELFYKTLEPAGHQIVGVSQTLPEALSIVQQQRVDLAILDVHLPNSVDGLAVANELLRYQWMPIIFVTGHDDDATLERIKATHPVGYLSKPFRPVDLTMKITLATDRFWSAQPPANLLPDYLFVPNENRLIPVSKTSIVYAEARGNFTCLFVRNRKDPYVVTDNLKNVAAHLTQSPFYRISRSHVVNLHYMAYIEGNQLFMQATDESAGVVLRGISIPAETRPNLLKRLTVLRAR